MRDPRVQSAAESGAATTVLWHVKMFSEADFPGDRRLYRWLVERALDPGAWVGSPGELYEQLDLPSSAEYGRVDTQ